MLRYRYQGCAVDANRANAALARRIVSAAMPAVPVGADVAQGLALDTAMTVHSCFEACARKGYKYFGLRTATNVVKLTLAASAIFEHTTTHVRQDVSGATGTVHVLTGSAKTAELYVTHDQLTRSFESGSNRTIRLQGTTATATATVDRYGHVVGIVVTNPGSMYEQNSPPEVKIAAPPAVLSSPTAIPFVGTVAIVEACASVKFDGHTGGSRTAVPHRSPAPQSRTAVSAVGVFRTAVPSQATNTRGTSAVLQ